MLLHIPKKRDLLPSIGDDGSICTGPLLYLNLRSNETCFLGLVPVLQVYVLGVDKGWPNVACTDMWLLVGRHCCIVDL